MTRHAQALSGDHVAELQSGGGGAGALGSVKQSGFGRELGRWFLSSFLEPKRKTRWLYDAGIGWYKTD